MDACAVAAAAGDLDALARASSRGFSCDEHAFYAAAANGHIGAMEWLNALAPRSPQEFGRGPIRWDPARVFADAVRAGRVAVLDFVERAGHRPWPLRARRRWTRRRNQYESSYNFNPPSYRPDTAFRGDPCAVAAEHGHMDVLRWLRSRACAWRGTAYLRAAVAGRTEVLTWLAAQDPPCPWGAATTPDAESSDSDIDSDDTSVSSDSWDREFARQMLSVAEHADDDALLDWMLSLPALTEFFRAEAPWHA